MRQPERFQTVVIGGGQAGLSVGYELARRGVRFVILDARDRIGDAWRKRWDSLRLFSPARFDGLAGMPFPAAANSFPTKDEMADYLEAYAARFDLPIRTQTRVDRLSRRGDHYRVEAGDRQFEAEQVVVAMSSYQRGRIPPFATRLHPETMQLHAGEYRNPSQLREGSVLVVGVGNSGAEIAVEVAGSGHKTWVSGRDVGQIPFRIGGLPGRLFLERLVFRFVFHRLLTLDTVFGRRAHLARAHRAVPLIRTRSPDLARAGTERVPRVVGVRDGLPLLADGRSFAVANVIWCTGFDPGFTLIDLPVLRDDGTPVHDRGVVAGEPGLHFVGLRFLYAASSEMIHGVGRDAEHVAERVAARAYGFGAVEAPRPSLPASANA